MHDRGQHRASPKKLGRYVLHHEFAAGGMASVYFGQLIGPVGFSRVVAIKRMHAIFARDPKLVTMFVDEAWLAARVQHPNVVSVLDVVAADGELFLVMDYVRGESLSGLMRAASAPPPADIAASILGQALSGLHAAHEARDEIGHALGIIHRDVSPQNVLVGVDGLARITDFGIAKAASRLTVTLESQLKGKLRYMAPEQLSGQPRIDRRADVYAAGVVLWETLAGERLTRGDTADAVLAAMLEPPPPLRDRRPDLPSAIDDVVARALAVDPDDRFPTADALQIAIESVLPFASPRAVGEWVQEAARDRLAAKKAVVDGIEQAVASRAGVKDELASLSQEVHATEARRLLQERAVAGAEPLAGEITRAAGAAARHGSYGGAPTGPTASAAGSPADREDGGGRKVGDDLPEGLVRAGRPRRPRDAEDEGRPPRPLRPRFSRAAPAREHPRGAAAREATRPKGDRGRRRGGERARVHRAAVDLAHAHARRRRSHEERSPSRIRGSRGRGALNPIAELQGREGIE